MSTRFIGNRNPTSTNRSGEARNRRTTRSQERVSSAAQRVVTPPRARPVVSRGNQFGTPIHRQASTKNARRQFYVAMDQPGAELRLPAIRLVNPGWRLLSAMIVVAVLVGMYSMWNSPYFRITAVEIQGLSRIDPAEMTSKLGLVDASIIEVDQKMILSDLYAAYPSLKDVQVSIELPNYVSITAAERQPVLAWQQGDQVSWVDAEGVIFPANGDAGPLVTIHSEAAPPAGEILLPEAAEQAEVQAAVGTTDSVAAEPMPASAAQAPKADLVVIEAAQVLSQKLPAETAMIYDPVHGLGWNDSQGSQVFIGRDLQSFEIKYRMYEQIASYLANQGVQAVMISVEHLNAPFYRLEQ